MEANFILLKTTKEINKCLSYIRHNSIWMLFFMILYNMDMDFNTQIYVVYEMAFLIYLS